MATTILADQFCTESPIKRTIKKEKSRFSTLQGANRVNIRVGANFELLKFLLMTQKQQPARRRGVLDTLEVQELAEEMKISLLYESLSRALTNLSKHVLSQFAVY